MPVAGWHGLVVRPFNGGRERRTLMRHQGLQAGTVLGVCCINSVLFYDREGFNLRRDLDRRRF